MEEQTKEDIHFNNRILICDDNESLHQDFRKILNFTPRSKNDIEISNLEEELFSNTPGFRPTRDFDVSFRIDSAYQGKEAYDLVDKAYQENDPYAAIFMDVRMPPGWDGIVTLERIWRKYPYTEAVIVTAYSDYTWDEIIDALGLNDKLLFIKKPFDSTTVKQLAINLTYKWNLGLRARRHIKGLEVELQKRMEALVNTLKHM